MLTRQTLRYRSKLGTSRATFKADDDLATVHARIAESLSSADGATIEIADKPSGPFQPLSTLHGQTISKVGMKHGDMLFLRFEDSPPIQTGENNTFESAIQSSANKVSGAHVELANVASRHVKADAWKSVKQHPVDDALERLSGKIPRPRDNKMCKHGSKGMCDYCMPLEREYNYR